MMPVSSVLMYQYNACTYMLDIHINGQLYKQQI